MEDKMDNTLIDLTGYVPEDYAKSSFGFNKVIDLSHIYSIHEMEDFEKAIKVITNKTRDHLRTLRINAKISVFNDKANNIVLLKEHKVVAQALLNMWHESVSNHMCFYYADVDKNEYIEETHMAFGINKTKRCDITFNKLVKIN